jgi:ATP-dependent DNA helicase UvrD/PcrA
MPSRTKVRLNKEQRKAVRLSPRTEKAGPLLILAGAGTGKTTTLGACVAAALAQGVAADSIMLLTFTRQASREMIASVRANAELHWAGTFHSVGYRLLREFGSTIGVAKNATVLDQSDARSLMAEIRTRLVSKQQAATVPTAENCLEIICWARNSRVSLTKALRTEFKSQRSCEAQLLLLAKRYRIQKRKRNVLDFDDLLAKTIRLLRDPSAEPSIREKFRFVFVDEYQDVNPLQVRFLKELKPDGRGLVVVGDDFQAINGFRSRPFNSITDLQREFSASIKLVKLKLNYRSLPAIVAVGNAVMEEATGVLPKTLRATRAGLAISKLLRPMDSSQQAITIVNEIQQSMIAGIPPSEHAVLFRTSIESTHIEAELRKRDVRFIKIGGQQLTDEAHIRAVVAALRWLENPKDNIAGRLARVPGIGKASWDRILGWLRRGEHKQALALLPEKAGAGGSLLLKELARAGVRADWHGQLRSIVAAYKLLPRGKEALIAQDLDEFVRVSERYPSRREFLLDLALGSRPVYGRSGDRPKAEDSIVLSTIHSAKGKEWKHVTVINVIDGCIPHERATTAAQIEEERRTLHVAVTRAQDTLVLTAPLRYPFYGRARVGQPVAQLSPFLTAKVQAHLTDGPFGHAPASANRSNPRTNFRTKCPKTQVKSRREQPIGSSGAG